MEGIGNLTMQTKLLFVLVLGGCLLQSSLYADADAIQKQKLQIGLKADIVLLVDSSNAIGQHSFDLMKQSLTEFVKSIEIAPDNIQVGVVTFNYNITPEIDLNQYHNESELSKAIASLKFKGGANQVELALRYVINNSFQASSGGRSDAEKLVILLTGTQPNYNKLQTFQSTLRKTGIDSIVIGTSCGLNKTGLYEVASEKDLVLTVNDFQTENIFWQDLYKNLLLKISEALSVSGLYPYGITAGDINTIAGDDRASSLTNMFVPFKYFNKNYTTFSVSNNGLVSLDQTITSYSKQVFPWSSGSVIAPFWMDLNYGKVWYRQTANSSLLSHISRDVRRLLPVNSSFDAGWAMIATWDKIHAYSENTQIYTFQAALATDGIKSFVIFNYGFISRKWISSTSAQVGFNGFDRKHYYNLKGAMSDKLSFLNVSSNVGIPGRWIFQVDGDTVLDNGAALTGTLGSKKQPKSDLQLFSPECVFHHNPSYSFCDCPYGINGNSCDRNVTTCLEKFKRFINTFIRCGYDKDDDEERCFIECKSGYQPKSSLTLNGVFHCTSCRTQILLSHGVDICVPGPNDVLG